MFDLKNKKKKSKKRNVHDILTEATVTTGASDNTAEDETTNATATDDSDYSYEYVSIKFIEFKQYSFLFRL